MTVTATATAGYPRSLANKGEVIVCSQRCRILGKISMNVITVDVTAVPHVKVGTTQLRRCLV